MWTQLQKFWAGPVIEDAEQLRLAALLYRLALIVGTASFLGTVIRLWVTTPTAPPWLAPTFLGVALLTGLLLWGGYVKAGTYVFCLTLWLGQTAVLFIYGIQNPFYGLHIIAILMMGLLLGWRMAALFSLLSVLASYTVFLRQSQGWQPPPSSITSAFTFWLATATGLVMVVLILYKWLKDLNLALHRAQISNVELVDTRKSLEARVSERTRDLALAAEIGRIALQIRNLDELLLQTVELVGSSFKFYHVQIYLADSAGRSLQLRAGTGHVGTELVRLGHRLPIGPGSINGTAAAEKQPIIVTNTATSRMFRPNQLLPHTRSEMSVPLVSGQQLIGVLNLQSDRPNALSWDSLTVFEVLARQLTVAIENARLFAELMEARHSLELQTRQLIREGWSDYLDAIERNERVGYVYEDAQLKPLAEALTFSPQQSLQTPIGLSGESIGMISLLAHSPDKSWSSSDIDLVEAVAQQVAQRLENLRLLADAERYRREAERANRRLVQEAWGDYLQGRSKSGYLYDQNRVIPDALEPIGAYYPQTAVSSPLTVQGETIGYLEAVSNQFTQKPQQTDEAAELVQAIAAQLSIHVENLRLNQQTEQALSETKARTEELAFVNRVVSNIAASLDLLQSLQFIVDELVDVLSIKQARIALFKDDRSALTVVAEHYDPSLSSSVLGYELPLPGNTATQLVVENRQALVIEHAQTDPIMAAVHDLMRDQGIYSLVILPLVAGNEVLGTLGLDLLEKDRFFTPQEIRLAETVVFQAAAALQNAQLFKQTQVALAEVEALYEGSSRVIRAEKVEDILLALLYSPSMQRFDRVDFVFFDQPVMPHESPTAVTAAASWQNQGHNRDIPSGIQPSGRRYEFHDYPGLSLLGVRDQIVIAHDIRTDSRFDDHLREVWHQQFGLSGMVNFPLRIGDEWFGSLIALTVTPMELSREDMRLIASLIDQSTIVIQNKRLLEQTSLALAETKRQARRLALLNEMSKELSTAVQLEDIYRLALSYTQLIVDTGCVTITLLDRTTNALEVAAATGKGALVMPVGSKFPVATTAVGQCIMQNKAIAIPDITQTPYTEMAALAKQGFYSILFVPFTSQSAGTFGTLNVAHSRAGIFDAPDENLIGQIASLLAATIEGRQLLVQAQRQAARERVVNSISQKIQSTTTVEGALQTAIQELGQALKARYTQVELGMIPDNGRSQPTASPSEQDK